MEITTSKLYAIGFYCFGVMAIMGVLNLLLNFAYLSIFSKISTGASILFNFVVGAFFKYMYDLENPKFIEETEPNIDTIIKELRRKEKRT